MVSLFQKVLHIEFLRFLFEFQKLRIERNKILDLLQTTPDVVISAFNQAGIYVEEQKDRWFIALVSIEKARAGRNI